MASRQVLQPTLQERWGSERPLGITEQGELGHRAGEWRQLQPANDVLGGINTEDACGLPRPERSEAWGLGDGDKTVLKQ